jgi:hypothetical protein
LASTRGQGVSSTHLGLLPKPTTALDNGLGTAGDSDYEGNRLTSRRRKVFIPLRVFLLIM